MGLLHLSSAQRDLIESPYIDKELFKRSGSKRLFEKELFRSDDGEDNSLFIKKNIENVQGDERDIIIFLFNGLCKELGRVARRFGWLNQKVENRLNVAITRKIKILIKSVSRRTSCTRFKNEGPKLLKSFMQYCYYISNKKTRTSKKCLGPT